MVFILVAPVYASVSGSEGAQQAVTVKGTVVDSNNDPLIGVSVFVVGASSGSVTDMDGKFSISVPANKTTLKFSYVGFSTQTVSVKNRKEIRVVLHEDLQQLDEVVVVGYGVQQKSHLTGGITKVNTDGMEDMPVSRLDQALMGKAAGVQILNVGGLVGEEPDISIRGTSSFSASSGPLVVVDGFPMDDGMSSINPSDVRSIEILKDAASAAIYGSRAANGVIMITTKSGTANKPKYSLKMKFGTREAYKLYPLLSTRDYILRRVDEYNLLGATLSTQDLAQWSLVNQYPETDWQREAIRDDAYYYSADFSISGGAKGLRYYVSGAYNSDNGILPKNSFDRYNFRARIDADLSKYVSVGVNLVPTYTKTEKPAGSFKDFYRQPSWMPIRHNEITSAITGYGVGEFTRGDQFNKKTYSGINPQTGEEYTVTNATPWSSSNNNPYGVIFNTFNPSEQYQMQLQGYIEIKPMAGLKFRSSNSYSYNNKETFLYRNEGARNANDASRGEYSNNKTVRVSSENTLSYQTKIKKIHSVDVLLGTSVYKNTTVRAGILGFDFSTDNIHQLSAAGRIDQYEGSNLRTGTWKSDDAMVSFYGRLNYALKDRYLLSATLRTDGSSKFGMDNKWGWFPSVAGGWRISEEPFMRSLSGWLNQLKIRASYGVTGTNSISNYVNTELLSPTPYPVGAGNGTVAQGMANISSSQGNRALQWEQTNEYNIGLDMAFLNNRIGLTFDCYYSVTKSLLYEKTINSISGFTKAWTNEGKLRNKGFEVELTTYNFNGRKFKWNTSFNLSLTRNRLLDLGGAAEQITQSSKHYYIARVGDPLVQYYGYKVIGVWKNDEEIAANAHHDSDRKGGLRVADINGDDVIDDNDRMPLGSPYPDFTWGMTNQLKYKDFDLSFVIQGQVGGKVYNANGENTELVDRSEKYYKGRWLSEEYPGNGRTPFRQVGFSAYLTDYLIEDAGFMALRDVTIGYNLPKKWARKMGISSLRIYATGQNLLYLMSSNYRGINPEARSERTVMTRNGGQNGTYPLMRTYNLGLNINF